MRQDDVQEMDDYPGELPTNAYLCTASEPRRAVAHLERASMGKEPYELSGEHLVAGCPPIDLAGSRPR